MIREEQALRSNIATIDRVEYTGHAPCNTDSLTAWQSFGSHPSPRTRRRSSRRCPYTHGAALL